MFTCDVCGREVFSCNIVNGMKFCAKCYQETFGNQQNKESSELLVNSLAEKDKQIAELQKQLAEKEKRLKQIDDWKANYGYTNYEDIYMLEDLQSRAFQSEDDTQIIDELLDYFNISDENKILPAIKQQLKSQPAEICQELIDMLTDRAELIEAGLCAEFMFTVYDLRESVEEILKEYQK